MSLYVCENCNCIENTALGQYWARNAKIYPEPYNGKKLCSECGSPFYIDGKPTKFGAWHGKGKKRTLEEYLKEHPDAKILNHDILEDYTA